MFVLFVRGFRRVRLSAIWRRPPVLAALVSATICASPGVPGQSPQNPLFQGRVDLAVVDVTVIDRDGRPIVGLGPDDFEVKLQGQRAPVRTLDFLRFAGEARATSASPAADAAPRVSSNQSAAAPGQSRGGRVIVLLFDDLSFRPDEGIELRVAAERMLASFEPQDLVGIVTTSGLGVLISPTRDRSVIQAALQDQRLMGRADPDPGYYISIPEAIAAMRGRGAGPFVGRECAILGQNDDSCGSRMSAAGRMLAEQTVERAATQLSAYTAVINALRAAPEPRIVIAFSGGIPLNATNRPGELDPVTRAAASASVQLFTLTPYVEGTDLRDRGRSGALPPNDRRSARRAENEYLIDGAKSVAEAAGGEGFTVIGQADRFLSRVLLETSAVYRLGVAAPPSVRPQDLLNVKVAVHRSGVSVHVRPAVTLPQPDAPPASAEEALRSRIAQGGVAFGVPLEIGTVLRRDADGQRVQVGVEAEVPATARAPLRAMYALIGPAGHIVRSGEATVASPEAGGEYRTTIGFAVPTGDYRLRVGVADADAHVGSIDRPLAAHLNHIGSVATSDVLLATTDGKSAPRALVVPNLPASAATLRVTFEIYPDPGQRLADDLRLRLTLSRGGESGPAIAQQDAKPVASGGAFVTAANLPVASLPPGTYDIAVAILEGQKSLGTLSTSFTKR